MFRNRFDYASKDILRASLEPDGAFQSDAEVLPDAQHADGYFEPDPSRPPTRADLGLIFRMTQSACTIEPFHATPGEDEVSECVRKILNFRHVLSLRKPAPPPPIQWIVSAGRPDGAIEGLALQPAEGWPRGVYRSPRLLRTWLVVVSELPETRETLLLRLMGAGRVLQAALAELRALPPEARERAIAMPVLLRYSLAVPADPAQRTSYDEEFLMSTHPIVEAWEREKEAKGEARGEHKGFVRGLILTYESRFGEMPSDLREIVQQTRNDATLSAWFKVAVSGTAEAFAEAVRRDQAA